MFNVEVFLSKFLLLLIHLYYIMIIAGKLHVLTYFPDFVKNTKTFQHACIGNKNDMEKVKNNMPYS